MRYRAPAPFSRPKPDPHPLTFQPVPDEEPDQLKTYTDAEFDELDEETLQTQITVLKSNLASNRCSDHDHANDINDDHDHDRGTPIDADHRVHDIDHAHDHGRGTPTDADHRAFDHDNDHDHGESNKTPTPWFRPNMTAIAEYKKKEEVYMQRASELDEMTKARDEQRKHYDNLR